MGSLLLKVIKTHIDMAKAAATKKTEKKVSREKLISAYKEYVLEEGHAPPSVFKFMRTLGYSEKEFYDYFGSFTALERSLWQDFIRQTVVILEKDEAYPEFNSREKLLSFYFTLIEVLKSNRSFVQQSWSWSPGQDPRPRTLRGFRDDFEDYVHEILAEGRATSEIKDRKYISDKYSDGLWLQTLFIIHYWLNDDSEGFSNTDAAIEKSVNLSFELMGAGPLDKMIDFAKFLIQHR